MKRNMGNIDRIVRMILAIMFVYLYANDIIPGVMGLLLMGLAVIFLLTGLVSFCPIYAIFGASTCKTKK